MSSSGSSVGLLPHRHRGFGPFINEIITASVIAIARNINDSAEKVFLVVSFNFIIVHACTIHPIEKIQQCCRCREKGPADEPFILQTNVIAKSSFRSLSVSAKYKLLCTEYGQLHLQKHCQFGYNLENF